MSTFLYDDFANGLWSPDANVWGDIDILADTILAVALDGAAYTAAQSDEVLQDIIAAGGLIATSDPITGIAVVARGFTSNPLNFPAVPAGPDITAIAFYKDGAGSDPTISPLILFHDDAATGLPVVTTGEDVVVNPGAGGWAVL